MDALRLFDRVSVDFPNRRVRLLGGSRSGLEGARFAAVRLQSSSAFAGEGDRAKHGGGVLRP
jgi:hypothetical protein